jgi:hypothetical protein
MAKEPGATFLEKDGFSCKAGHRAQGKADIRRHAGSRSPPPFPSASSPTSC